MNVKNAFCSYCGTVYTNDCWPRKCFACGNITWRNPTPVALLIQPVGKAGEKVVLIRRGIEPGKNGLALPGGYIDYGESWELAAAREGKEEAGLLVDSDRIELFDVRQSTHKGNILTFGVAPPIENESELPLFIPNDEVTERILVDMPIELVFGSHTLELIRYFNMRPWFPWKRRYEPMILFYDLDKGNLEEALAWIEKSYHPGYSEQNKNTGSFCIVLYSDRDRKLSGVWMKNIIDAGAYFLEKPPGYDNVDAEMKKRFIHAALDNGHPSLGMGSPYWPQCPLCARGYPACPHCKNQVDPKIRKAAIERYGSPDLSPDELRRYFMLHGIGEE